MPNGDGEEVKTTYFVSLETTAGHSAADLRIVSVLQRRRARKVGINGGEI
jgi:hypothetical protein